MGPGGASMLPSDDDRPRQRRLRANRELLRGTMVGQCALSRGSAVYTATGSRDDAGRETMPT
jgi:hypothetical protein